MSVDRGIEGRDHLRVVAVGVALACAVVAALLIDLLGSSKAAIMMHRERHPQTTWAACNRNAHNHKPSTFHPLSDRAAAALVTPQVETRPDNDRAYTLGRTRYRAPNYYVPSRAQVRRFRRARTSAGQTNVQFNPYYAYVDGDDGLHRPTTDELIQWGAHKWGIPEDWLRAEYVHESYWNQFMLGDDTPVSGRAYRRYPSQSRVAGSNGVYQSLGITQVRWTPDGSLHPGTEPLRWLSTAFNIDYQAATLRFYYDNPQQSRSAWNDGSYRPCQAWSSVGAWFSPYPWGNSGQATYAGAVRQILAQRDWTSNAFVTWKPGSLPPGIKLH
jgi:hypothetical protein